MGMFRLPPPSAPPQPVIVTQREPEKHVPTYKPAIYDWESNKDATLADIVGSAAYYKSRAFKIKKAKGEDQAPGRMREDTEQDAASDSKDEDMPDAEPDKPKSLIMIFGRTTVRRATTNDKFYLRMKRYNKRT